MPIPTKAKCIALLEHARADQQALIDQSSARQLEAHGTFEHWAIKDLVAHITYWLTDLLERLDRINGDVPRAQVDFDEQNRETFERNAARPWAEIRDDWERAQNGLVSRVTELDEAQLFDDKRYPSLDGVNLANHIVGIAFDHSVFHLAIYYVENGETARARALQERATTARIDFDDSPRSRGTALYNLACYSALDGDAARALELLKEALSLVPNLKEWSKQDSDLISLRDLPAFKELTA